jgi:hypothetical protein
VSIQTLICTFVFDIGKICVNGQSFDGGSLVVEVECSSSLSEVTLSTAAETLALWLNRQERTVCAILKRGRWCPLTAPKWMLQDSHDFVSAQNRHALFPGGMHCYFVPTAD